MASFYDAREFRGNQGEEGDVDVISAEPIAMIVPPELQDSPRAAAPENDASSSVSGGSEDHQPSTSSDSSTEEAASEAEGVEEVGCSAPATSAATEVVVFEGWESKVLSGRLSNLRKAPKTLPAGFRFRAALHHEVVDGAATVKGYIKLEEMVRRYHIPRTILIRAGTLNERACLVSRTGWVPVYVDHFDAGLRFPLPGLIFDVLAEYELALSQLTPNSIKFIIGFMLLCERLGMLAKAVVFRSFFLCRLCPSTSGTRWYYILGREKMMIFTNIRNKVARWKRQFVFVRDTRTDRINTELAARLSEWRTPNTFMNYPQLTSGDVDLENRLLDYVKARGLVDLEALVTPEQIAVLGYTVALFECEQGAKAQNNELQKTCKQLATEKASLTDEVSCLQSSEMADRAASAESRAEELARKVDELKEELVRAQVERESGIQATREEASRAEDRAKKAEAEREKTLHELSAMAERVSQADQHVAQAEASLEKCKRLHQRDLCFARAQEAEWLVGAEMFQDAVAVAAANTTTDIFNEVRGKVLGVRADFPICELAFFEGEEIDADGKSLAQPADTRVKLKWELNEEGLLVWPPSVVEEGEDTEGLPSFDAWVAGPHDVSAEPSSTPPSAQPQFASGAIPVRSPVPPPDRSSPARSPAAGPDNASIPVDLTDD
ncbi:hypothetical protein SLEP1_g45620 [Rubroshorea leprosula]|uniref:Transposase (putative) gypsy type domain-containing protein n=1 Tax=Rubroshorea leprosula TaxID=152421 RepID=A0AAV5LJK4_9ROSI|nr:hypothetical protein SLEP1_g45620 [Rubroshorea leprosula]